MLNLLAKTEFKSVLKNRFLTPTIYDNFINSLQFIILGDTQKQRL